VEFTEMTDAEYSKFKHAANLRVSP
jgi:hypothetical protein